MEDENTNNTNSNDPTVTTHIKNETNSSTSNPNPQPKDETIIICSLVVAATLIISAVIIALAICLRKGDVEEKVIVDGRNPLYGKYYDDAGERIGTAQVQDRSPLYQFGETEPSSTRMACIRDNNSQYPGRNEDRMSEIRNGTYI